MSTRILAIANRKGGTGKTTTSVNLTASLAEHGKSVLLVDLDAQSNASLWMGVSDVDDRGTLDLLMGEATPDEVAVAVSHGDLTMHVVPATKRMTSADRLLEQEQFGQDEKLKEALGGAVGRWDYVVLDCPANFGRVTVNALAAATDLLIPVEASDMAVDGTADLLEVFQQIRKYKNESLRLLGFLVCQVDHRTNHAKSVVETMRTHFPKHVFDTTIARNVAVPDSYRRQLPTVLMDPSARASEEYKRLAGDLLATFFSSTTPSQP